MGLLSEVGITLLLSVGIFMWMGYYIDQFLGTIFLFTIIFALAGGIGGLYTVYLKIEKKDKKKR